MRSFGITELSVFGSFAAGEQTPESDVDLLVRLEHPVGLRFVSAAAYLEEVLGRRVDLTDVECLRERLRERVAKESVRVR